MSAKEVTSTEKKKRKANFSPSETALLVNLAEKDLSTIRGKFSSTVSNLKKQIVWQKITEQINSLGFEKRTCKEVKEKWNNLKQNAKTIHAGLVKSRTKTGGGPAAKPPTSTMDKVITLFEDEPSFSGIQGGFESGLSSCLGRFYS